MDLNTVPPSGPDHVNEGTAALKMAGGTALVGAYGLTLNEWVAVLTILYMICQIGLLIPKYYALVSSGIKRWKDASTSGN